MRYLLRLKNDFSFKVEGIQIRVASSSVKGLPILTKNIPKLGGL